jgi:hypothetical protein
MLDLRGTGQSATTDHGNYRCDRLVDHVCALQDHLQLDASDLLGNGGAKSPCSSRLGIAAGEQAGSGWSEHQGRRPRSRRYGDAPSCSSRTALVPEAAAALSDPGDGISR